MNPGNTPFPMLHDSITIMTPFLLAASGGLFTELAGVLNIALEGLMLIGAFFSVTFTALTGNLFLGILLGMVFSMAAALLYGVISLKLQANIFITGLATNLLASGLTVMLSQYLFGTKGVVRFPDIQHLPVLRIPGIHDIPVLGDLLSGHNVLVYASWAVLALTAVLLYLTPFGLRVRATGLNADSVTALGLRPIGYQLRAILLSGAACGMAGAMLSLNISAFVPNITAGRGWIALVVIYLGNRTPLGILVASFVFGLAETVSIFAQGVIALPAEIILAFPYIVTVAAMVLYSIWQTRIQRQHHAHR